MVNLLSDVKTYKEVQRNFLQSLQKQTYTILNNLNNNGFLYKKFHKNSLTQSDTMLANCYGLTKIHKNDVPLRPIISLINSPTYTLAKILYQELKNSITKPLSHINNSFGLKEKLKDIVLDDDYRLLSLDVTSLFTNIPCQLVLNSLDRQAVSVHGKCNIPLDEIRSCTTFLVNNTFFTFNGKIYQQIYGIPMGSPISPLFADIVMEDLERDCLQILKEKHDCIPTFYFRYIDDTIICVKKEHIDSVIKVFNSYDQNLKFTHELEVDNRINFLDLSLIRNNRKIITNWFQKPTSSGRLINYFSNHPTK